jgi:predicted nucleic acid-binding protein
MIVPEAVYAPAKQRAFMRVPRDPDDWPAVALAMGLDAGIWTVDADFLGCGLPTWTMDTLLAEVTRAS